MLNSFRGPANSRWFGPLAAAALFLSIFLVVTALTPITLTTSGGVSSEQVADGTWEVVPRASSTRIIVKSRGPGVAKLAAPELRWPEIFEPGMVRVKTGFSADPESGGYTSRGRGSLVIAGVFGNVGFQLLQDSTVRSILVSRLDHDGRLNVILEPGEGTLFLSPDTTFQRTTSFLWRSIPADLDRPEESGLAGSVGNERIDAAGKDVLSISDTAPEVLRAFLGGTLVFAGALILLILGWGLGRSLEPDSRSSLPRIAVHAAGGLTLFALVANSVSYLTGTQWTSWVLVSVGLVVIAARHASRERLSSAIGDLGRLVKMLAWVLPPAIVLFFPMFHWGFWYAGEYNTDLFQYTLLASLAKEHSLLALRGSVEAGNAGLIAAGAGFEWRSIDTVLASVTSVVFMSTSLAAFATLGCIMFFLFALGIVAMVADRRSSIFEYALAALLLLNPLFVLLFVESYQSHYFFVALVPGLILAFKEAVTVSAEERGARLWVRIVFLAAIAAAAVASYPHFAALLGFALFLAALVAKVQIKLLLGVVARTVAVIVLVLNIGLLAMRQISEATRWEAGLNDIARYVLLDPYANWQLPSLAFGTTPYRWRWPYMDPEQYMGFLGGHLWELGQASWTPGALEAGAIALFIGGTLFLLNWSKSLRDVAFVSAIAVVAAFGVLMLYMGYQDSLYGALKVGWTAAALFVVVIASAIYRKGTVFVVVLLLLPLSVLWLRTDLLDRSTWLINREGSAALLSHSSAQPDITRVESVLREGPESVALLRGPQPLSGSDRDNVAYNQIRALVRDHGVPCRGCREYPLIASELTTTVECALDTDVIIRIGVSDRSRLCGKPRIVSGAFVEVYR